jgi:hypothetical protein
VAFFVSALRLPRDVGILVVADVLADVPTLAEFRFGFVVVAVIDLEVVFEIGIAVDGRE